MDYVGRCKAECGKAQVNGITLQTYWHQTYRILVNLAHDSVRLCLLISHFILSTHAKLIIELKR